jgi:hypothetical protein
MTDTSITIISNCVTILQNVTLDVNGKAAIKVNFQALMYNMLGITFDGKKLSTTSQWYSNWLSGNNYAANLLIIMNMVSSKSTAQFHTFHGYVNTLVNKVISRYFDEIIPQTYLNGAPVGTKPLLVSVGALGYTELLEELYNFLWHGGTGIRGLGNEEIKSICKRFNRDQVTKDPEIQKWCGCFSKNDPVAIHALQKYPEHSSYTKACDPLCIHDSSIKLIDTTTYETKRCNAKLCIMTNASIANSGYKGTISLNQTCPCSVEGEACFCIIDTTIQKILNTTTAPNGGGMSSSAVFKQYCPGARCMVEQYDGSLIETECENDAPSHTNQIHKERITSEANITRSRGDIIFILGIFAGIIILFILCARHIIFEPKIKITNIIKNTPNVSKYTRTTDLGYLDKR